MSNHDNTNRGAIWKNDKKQTDKHPDFKGELDVGGRKYWVSAWKRREDASPKSPALSFKIEPKEEQPSISRQAQARIRKPDPISSGRSLIDELDDEVPF